MPLLFRVSLPDFTRFNYKELRVFQKLGVLLVYLFTCVLAYLLFTKFLLQCLCQRRDNLE